MNDKYMPKLYINGVFFGHLKSNTVEDCMDGTYKCKLDVDETWKNSVLRIRKDDNLDLNKRVRIKDEFNNFEVAQLTQTMEDDFIGINMNSDGLFPIMMFENVEDNSLKYGDYVRVIDKEICNIYKNVSADAIYKVDYSKQELGTLKYVKLCGIDIMFREDTLKKVEVKL